MSLGKKLGGVLGTSVLVFGGYMYATDEGTRRGMKFWVNIMPIFMHYRAVQFLNRDLGILPDEIADPYYDKLHEKYSYPVKELTYELRGFYLKNAQIMSVQDDFVPLAYMKWIKDTQDNVPSEFKGDEARKYCADMMKKDNNLNFDDVFEYWDDEPIGVASIGEVHRARLRSGQEVAVKLQFPGMERRFRADIHTIKTFCELAMPQHVSAFAEMEKQFVTEFNYKGEGENLIKIRDKVMQKYGNYVEIPRPYLDLCSQHVLVMDFLKGKKLVDGIRENYEEIAKSVGKSLKELENERLQDIKDGKYQLRSIEEETRLNNTLAWYRWFNDVRKPNNIRAFLYNYSFLPYLYRNFDNSAGFMQYEWSKPLLQIGKLIELLCEVHAFEIFQVGCYNGDPHPGNILLLEDGRLGLIDYGQVKCNDEKERYLYAQLLLAHLTYDKDEVTRIYFDEMGLKTKHHNKEIAYLHSAFWNDRDTVDVTKGMNISTFLDWCEAQDPMEQLPEAYLFFSRVNVLMRGMGNAFGLKMRMSELWEREARDYIARYNSRKK